LNLVLYVVKSWAVDSLELELGVYVRGVHWTVREEWEEIDLK
jgi:hypothetical protein